MNLGLEGRRALVGGATSGLGAAVAEALAAEGCRLVLWARDESRLEVAAAGLRDRHGVDVDAVAADAADVSASDAVVAAATAGGEVDIAILNSGGPPPVDPLATTANGWRDALQLLLLTPVAIATALLPAMVERRFGRVVAILSSGIREPIPNLVYSNAGRAALAAWLKTASRPVAAAGVTVNGVVPGRIATARTAQLDEIRAKNEGRRVEEVRADSAAQIPVGRYGDPAEFAAVVTFLCSARASYVNGVLVPADGGMGRSV